ncbi:hypothetical protein PYW08_014150 [Mythimna loreyi]|uniref:Uncharacterized protein n=1 Tax=Mythimna loreyi TaxID=667449 RepID=A0ACC2RBA5_9NEOP|nr:hypothetical protein PYW08_014150 [Mythimna loreyi]
MPQKFQVLRCYACSTFQAHQTKKSNKWECRICGKKQSCKRFYGLGTAKECRFQVQKLNAMRGQLDSTESPPEQDSDSSSKEEEPDWAIEPVQDTHSPIKPQNKPISKWSQYLEEKGPLPANAKANSSEDEEVVFEIPKKLKKLHNESLKKKSTFSIIDIRPEIPDAIGHFASTGSKPAQPSLNSKAYHPEETFSKIKPSNKKSVPAAVKKPTMPDLTEQISLLPPFENFDGLCSDSMMAKPFTWREDTNDLDALNI